MEPRKKLDFKAQREVAEFENEYFIESLKVGNLTDPNPRAVDVKERYRDIRDITLMMSMDKRSVDMVRSLMAVIFVVSDVEDLDGQLEKQVAVIVKKFNALKDLQNTLRVPMHQLLMYASSEICGQITYLLILNKEALSVINQFLGIEFYLNNILPRSWFYLLSKKKLTYEKLKESFLPLNFGGLKITLQRIRENLYECIAKIAFTDKMNASQKKNLIQMLKNTFGFQSDQELLDLYNSEFSNDHSQKNYFETKLLINLSKRFSFGKQYFLEKLMKRGDKVFTLPYYDKKQFIQVDFYNRKPDNKKAQQFRQALEFIAKEFKRASIQQSDFGIGFLEAFDSMYPQCLLKESDSMKRQNRLLQFIMTVELLIKENLVEDTYFKTSLIMMAIYVLKLGIEKEDTVEIAIFSMQLLLNAIGLQQSLPFINKFCSLAVQAYIKFPDKIKIKKYTSKIINFYVKDKQRYTQYQYKDLQFILLNKLKENPVFADAITCITSVLYQKPEDIAENLKNLVTSLRTGNEDIRLLNTSYILELLEQQDQDSIRKVLVTPDILKIVYQGILEMPQGYETENSRKLSIICGKVVAAIGLCQSFVNDPLTLKATNQTTLLRGKDTEYGKHSDDKNPNLIKSDYYNPITNQKYKNQESGEDNTLEILAVASLNDIQIERKDPCFFAKQVLAKLKSMTSVSDTKPQKFYYTQFMLDKFINQLTKNETKDPNMAEEIAKQLHNQEALTKTVLKFIGKDLEKARLIEFPAGNSSSTLRQLCLYLIGKIQHKQWQELFEACIPAIKQSYKVLELLLPYIIYYALRFNQSEPTLPEMIGKLFNTIFDTELTAQIVTVLKVQDFLKICYNQDKRVFKKFIEVETKFKYVEKLYHLEFDSSKIKDQNVLNFIKCIESNEEVKNSFFTVRKIKSLLLVTDKIKKIKAAKQVKAFQRCIYSFEEHFRGAPGYIGMQSKGFLEILSPEDTVEIINFHKQLNPEDFSYGLFNSIIHNHRLKQRYVDVTMEDHEALAQKEEEIIITQNKKVGAKLEKMLQKTSVIQYWKDGQWERLHEWASEIDIMEFTSDITFLKREIDNPIEKFEMLIAIFISEYSKGLQSLLHSEDGIDNKGYQDSLKKINHFFELLYSQFIFSLDGMQGEISYYYKLFLHVIYEMESAVHYLKDVLFSEKDRVQEILKKEVNREKRRFEKIYYEFDMNNYFEKLLSWFEERSQLIQSSTESLKLIYYARRMIFSLFDRENEYAYYLMRIARIYRKTSDDILEISKLFKECEAFEAKIIDYDLEYAKYIMKTKNAHEAYQYLINKQELIKDKCDKIYKATKFHWMPQRVYEKAILMSIELQIKLDPHNPNILKRFDDFLKAMGKNQWEKPVFRFAQYLDELDIKSKPVNAASDPADQKKRQIQKIFYFITSLKYGYKYIWQSFPRALELWFDYNERESDSDKINNFMKQELLRLEIFKLASVLQILLSRYGHPNAQVREIIMLVLSRIAIQYPSQCAWWILHFLHFEQESTPAVRKQQASRLQAITRAEFARSLLGKILAQNEQAEKVILSSEKIFVELKKLSEKNPPQPNATTMEISQNLQKIQTVSNLVMPIEQNLSPQIPPQNFYMNYSQSSLVCTTSPIIEFNKKNADATILFGMKDTQMMNQEEEKTNFGCTQESVQNFPAFKPNPVMISGFVTQATVMHSKEKPKKIGIIGSDHQVYNFLLKCDKHGDLRKEQRFIDFAVLCNKMLENDSEARKRNLKLRTNAIVPLSRNTGLIEWIQNTSTLKTVVGDHWKKNNIKGEMQDIKKKAQDLKAGETHTAIWQILKEEIKPVLGVWMQDHFPSPELWYEAKINFIRSTAIWSMIGYVIGLGDRHGDNILIHQHTGEVTHVDFDCIFEKGAKLKIPEIVPFRLTQNIIDAFGIFKEKGIFYRTCEVVQRVLRKNSKNIVSFLDSFVHDPLIESTQNIKVEINQALDVVRHKLLGHIKGEQGGSVTIEEQVEQVILQGINDEALSKMYIGWMPWL